MRNNTSSHIQTVTPHCNLWVFTASYNEIIIHLCQIENRVSSKKHVLVG